MSLGVILVGNIEMNWTIIKNCFMVFSSLYGFVSCFNATHVTPPMTYKALIIILFALPFMLLFVISIQVKNPRSDKVWEIPKWNMNPLNLRQPLVLFHFSAFFFICHGIGAICALPFVKGPIIPETFISLVMGLGALIGVWFCTTIFRSKFKNRV